MYRVGLFRTGMSRAGMFRADVSRAGTSRAGVSLVGVIRVGVSIAPYAEKTLAPITTRATEAEVFQTQKTVKHLRVRQVAQALSAIPLTRKLHL